MSFCIRIRYRSRTYRFHVLCSALILTAKTLFPFFLIWADLKDRARYLDNMPIMPWIFCWCNTFERDLLIFGNLVRWSYSNCSLLYCQLELKVSMWFASLEPRPPQIAHQVRGILRGCTVRDSFINSILEYEQLQKVIFFDRYLVFNYFVSNRPFNKMLRLVPI